MYPGAGRDVPTGRRNLMQIQLNEDPDIIPVLVPYLII
jgi:hypothetical protein